VDRVAMNDGETTDLTASRWWSVDELEGPEPMSSSRAISRRGSARSWSNATIDPGRRRRLSSGRQRPREATIGWV
jgi:hypothetical protein